MAHALIWFRDDLRLADNPALQAALGAGLVPVPVYLHAPGEEGDWAPGAASDAWRARSLASLARDLSARGSRLHVACGPTQDALQRIAQEVRAEAVFWNRRYGPATEARDAAVKRALRERGVRAESHNGALLIEPWALQTRSGSPYRVFTPFWRAASAQLSLPAPTEPPPRLPAPPVISGGVDVAELGLAPAHDWDAGFWQAWTPGEAGASAALGAFVAEALDGYATGRDRPDRRGTSRLSPHLHFGEIAPWRVVRAVDAAARGEDREAFVRELGWREFAHHVLHHFPHTPDADFDPRLEGFAWSELPPDLLRRWRRGRTGIPLVDAGMRQLWHTGWMHNRVRMIVASFLTKNLRAHWRVGARWFWDTLVDADLANNTLGWQWVAGTGADAAPYHRVFNPVLQAQRFDPDGAYIARWIPELAHLPPAQRHAPWTGTIPAGYPRPMVDLRQSRRAALDALEQIRRRRGAEDAGSG